MLWRPYRGRRRLVVPLAVAVGWEFMVDDRVVIVRDVHEHTIVVQHTDGKTEEIEVVKEDTEENTEDFEGSEYEEEPDEDE